MLAIKFKIKGKYAPNLNMIYNKTIQKEPGSTELRSSPTPAGSAR